MMLHFCRAIQSFLHDETGATMVEYALMVVLIAVVCVTAVTLLGTALVQPFQNATDGFS